MYNIYENHQIPVPIEYKAEIVTGVDGWRLVRYLVEGSSIWHPINDNLAGTSTYGIPYDYNNNWSILFEEYNELCFSTFDMEHWLYCTKDAVIGENYTNSARPIIRSSTSDILNNLTNSLIPVSNVIDALNPAFSIFLLLTK